MDRNRQSRLALWLTIRCQLTCFAGFLVGYFVAPLFQMNNAQDRLLVCAYFVAPLFIIETIRTMREGHREVMRTQQEENDEWNRLVNARSPNPDAPPESN